MSGSSDQRLSIRLSFDGAQEARAQLEQLGQVGDTAMRKLEAGGQAASRGVAAISAAGDALRSGLGQINGDLANTGRQFEDLARSTVGLATALRTGAGLAGAISGVVAVAGAAYTIFQNWGAISKGFGDTIDWLTGRYRSNGEELKKVNDLLVDFSRLSETAAQRGVRTQIESLNALVAQAQVAREAIVTDIAGLRGEIERQVGFTQERLQELSQAPAPTGRRRGQGLNAATGALIQREGLQAAERAESDPAIESLRRDIAAREGALADLDRRAAFIRAQAAALGEATGSVLNAPAAAEATRATREASTARAELTEAEREYQRLVQQGVQLAGTAATEQQRYGEQVLALSAALGAARITQEQYNAAVAALDPAARAAREAQEQAARQAEQFARRSRDALAMIGETAMDRMNTAWGQVRPGAELRDQPTLKHRRSIVEIDDRAGGTRPAFRHDDDRRRPRPAPRHCSAEKSRHKGRGPKVHGTAGGAQE
jgi:hypothetical protein